MLIIETRGIAMKHHHHTYSYDEPVYGSTVWGSNDNDFIVNDRGHSMLIQGFGGNDWIGDEIYHADDPSAIVQPTTDDRYEGGSGDDFISIVSGNDQVYGNAGTDYIQNMSRSAYIFADGGLGDDTIDIWGDPSNFTKTKVGDHTIYTNGHRTIEIANIEHVSINTDVFQF